MRIRTGWMLLCLGVACVTPAPVPWYSEDILGPVLTDIHVARGAVQNAPSTDRDSLYAVLFAQICSIHQVDRDSLEHDLTLLRTDPDLMEKIYRGIIDSLDNAVHPW